MKPNDIASKFFDKSLAFLEGAIATSKANDLSMFNTAEYMGVTAHLLHHSIELFLKFAIVVATQTLTKNEHSIIKLHGKYKNQGNRMKIILPREAPLSQRESHLKMPLVVV